MSEINHRYLMDKEGNNYFPITHTDAVIGIENIAKAKPLEGKKIVMFGDSITELGDYPELVGHSLGSSIVKGGFYGCRMAYHSNNTYMNNQSMQKMSEYIKRKDFSELVQSTEEYFNNGGRDYRTQAKNLNNVDWDSIDIITVLFGVNDFTNVSPIGSNTDTTGSTFKGAINKIIKNISETLPKVRIIFITPMFMSRIYSKNGENSDDNPNKNGVYFKEYVNAIVEVSKLNHVVSINLNDLSGVNRYNSDIYLVDGKHPSSYGYSHIARIISNQIELLY